MRVPPDLRFSDCSHLFSAFSTTFYYCADTLSIEQEPENAILSENNNQNIFHFNIFRITLLYPRHGFQRELTISKCYTFQSIAGFTLNVICLLVFLWRIRFYLRLLIITAVIGVCKYQILTDRYHYITYFYSTIFVKSYKL